MTSPKPILAIGIGSRRACDPAALAALVRGALARLPLQIAASHRVALFTLDAKRGQAPPQVAAQLLGLDLNFLPRDALEAAMAGVTQHSSRAKALFGVASVAEAAALAGAGQGAKLLVPRMADNGATCAIAAHWEQP